MEAAFYETLSDRRVRCRARENRNGALEARTYARASSIALDPVEKKPLYHFLPGRQVLSMGSWGCNLSCGFCQNHGISQQEVETEELLPEQAVRLAQTQRSFGIAYTYNEPLVAWEYLRDCGRLMREAGGEKGGGGGGGGGEGRG